MATDLRTIGPNTSADIDSAAEEPHLFRFRLRQLLAVVTIICLLLTAIVYSSGLAAAVLLLATLVVVFHVFSTALATQLRSHTDRSVALHSPPFVERSQPVADANQPLPACMPRSPWHARASTPLPWLPRMVAAVALCGGVLGAVVLTLTADRPISLPGIAVGSISIAIVAGWFAFLGYSFYSVFRHGLTQAMPEERNDRLG
jgi:hypothetical protein